IGIKMSLNGLDGKTNEVIKQIRDNIFKVLGQVEVDIDYPEYESTPDVSKKEILNIFKKSTVLINKIIQSSNKLIKIKDGIRVAIIGKPNVGKSSLLNALLKEDKAIVSSIPGTTRDVIEASCVINGIKFDFIDTAGIRKANNSIEKIGITKAKNTYKNADLVLLVIDNSKKITEQDKSLLSNTNKLNRIVVLNKSDKPKANSILGIKISAKANNISELIKKLSNFNNLQSIDFKNEILMQSQQSIALLESALSNIKLAQKIYLSNKEFELSANYLHNAINKLEQILGISNDVSFVDELFSKFCVGK
ncbi:MAG: 50S ribosome-binding GTPase, partial [Mycoplasmoidaceae bacterium]|nr:50S ribosome-binding GTPase [Mycoplasmoidaceae bacterium]